MNKTKYNKMVKELTPKENTIINTILSFIVGGTIGILSCFLFNFFLKYYNEQLSISFTLLVLIIISSLLTALGFADSLFSKFKCGLIIPITGFAHSITSSLIDYKREGFLNMGSNAFKLAGSVILYGIVSAVILTLIKVIING